MLPDRFLRRPSVQLLGPPVPVRDDVIHITDKNGVVREIEQAGLLGSFRHFLFEFVAGLQKVSLDAAPNGAEPGNKRRKQYENDIVRELRTVQRRECEAAL